ncbi:hypothetical protein SLEP1_g58197 [Rubroshorea leprosula]|nr:hypothetical protein SLEP1_g58197 [Rubroshorea leprosula]
MGSKRLLSNSSVSASSTVEGKTDKKLKGLATADLNPDEGEVKGNGGKGKVVGQGKNDNKEQGLVGTNQNSKEGAFKVVDDLTYNCHIKNFLLSCFYKNVV